MRGRLYLLWELSGYEAGADMWIRQTSADSKAGAYSIVDAWAAERRSGDWRRIDRIVIRGPGDQFELVWDGSDYVRAA